jgi:hypothetical protein
VADVLIENLKNDAFIFKKKIKKPCLFINEKYICHR